MKVRFWGVRGSIPTPGSDTAKYGGNTTCIQVETQDGQQLILDAGTGIRPLGLQLMQQQSLNCSVFISHTHWDHIQGLPFFVPLFTPQATVRLYGAFDPVYQKDLKHILTQQMEYCYFPVREMELKAQHSYHTLREGDVVDVGSAQVQCVLMNHPVLTYGYRVDCDGGSLFFCGDHEPPHNIYEPEDPEYAMYQALIEEKVNRIARVAHGVDAILVDAMYTETELESKRGWGHGTIQSGLDLARKAQAKTVYFTHHDPTRTDLKLDEILKALRANSQPDDPAIVMAFEGLEFSLPPKRTTTAAGLPD